MLAKQRKQTVISETQAPETPSSTVAPKPTLDKKDLAKERARALARARALKLACQRKEEKKEDLHLKTPKQSLSVTSSSHSEQVDQIHQIKQKELELENQKKVEEELAAMEKKELELK